MPVPDFSPGEVLTAAAMDSIGLWLVKTQTVGTAVSSVTVTNAFNADFENYRIIFSSVDASAVTGNTIKFGAATTNYYYSQFFDNFNGLTTGTDRNNNTLPFLQCGVSAQNDDTNVSFDVFNPFLTKRTSIAGSYFCGAFTGFFGGVLADSTSYTAFTLGPATGTYTGGTIRVYGYRN